jgi:LAO/AO transport system kinase
MGDAIQAIKAGILETADVLVVNKADKPGAQETVRDLRGMVAMVPRREGWWRPPIVCTTAVAGEGAAELAERVDQHWSWLDATGQGSTRRNARAREEVSAIALAGLRRLLGGLPGDSRLDDLATAVAHGDIDAFSAADELVAAMDG